MAARIINNFLQLFGIQLKKIKALETERNHYAKIINGAACILEVHKKYEGTILNGELSGLVFSKDRAMQLHALLTSYFEKVQNFSPLSILYKTTSEKSRQSYEALTMEFAHFPIQFIKENKFNEQVKAWLATGSADRIFFMTDDAVFLDAFDMKDALLFNPLNEIFSLTKGKDLRYCFTKNVKQELPVFDTVVQRNGKSFNSWRWGDSPGSHDWAYPLSVDGTFFLREEMLRLVSNINFNNPNSLEANMQVFISIFLPRKGVCYDKVKVINVPCNVVQNEIDNRSTGFFSAGELQSFWEEGKRIDVKMFYGLSAFEAEHARYTFIQNKGHN